MDFTEGAAGELSSRWLQPMSPSPQLQEAVLGDVADRLDSMPSALRAAFRSIDRGLGTLPGPVRGWVQRLPGFSEYVQVVESLTAVSYFDLMTKPAIIPAQGGREAVAAGVETRA